MNEWWLIGGMMAVTFGVRYPVLALLSRWQMPASVYRALEFVPVAVLSAIIVPLVLAPEGELSIAVNNPQLLAAVFAITVAAVTRRLLPTIVLGMLLFLALRWLL